MGCSRYSEGELNFSTVLTKTVIAIAASFVLCVAVATNSPLALETRCECVAKTTTILPTIVALLP
jgi:hypothetical protein